LFTLFDEIFEQDIGYCKAEKGLLREVEWEVKKLQGSNFPKIRFKLIFKK
jgi:hypothetical protein